MRMLLGEYALPNLGVQSFVLRDPSGLQPETHPRPLHDRTHCVKRSGDCKIQPIDLHRRNCIPIPIDSQARRIICPSAAITDPKA